MLTLREPRSHHSRFALTRVLWASGKKPEIGGGGYGAEALAQPQPEAREERETRGKALQAKHVRRPRLAESDGSAVEAEGGVVWCGTSEWDTGAR